VRDGRADSGLVTPPQLGSTLVVDGEHFDVKRSWPGTESSRVVECTDSAGRIRAATLAAGGAVEMLGYGSDPQLRTLSPHAELLVHRAGRRAVERTAHGFVKHLRRRKIASTAAAARAMGTLAERAGFAAPEVREVSAGSIAMSTVPGVNLLALDGEEWRRAWRTWASCWPQLALSEPDGADGGRWRVHDAAAEAEVVATWLGHVRSFDPDGLAQRNRERIDAAEAEVRRTLMKGPAAGRSVVVAHRDLHDGQLLYDPASGCLGILDFDTAVLAERELDLANLDVHIELRVAQGLLDASRAAHAQESIAEASAALGADASRMEAYRKATRTRLFGVYAFRPQWVEVAEALLRTS
jgi:hypothetical protein